MGCFVFPDNSKYHIAEIRKWLDKNKNDQDLIERFVPYY
jgi:hypothetical protein